ncbi:DUF4307 domain-containing protein [Kineococcus sp. R8]|uniref:DUF4307 domain-containing protein n=1 Tax=Kineococcus siccus TaxID=2696567 RepID=UPI0014127B45|nr:DUF4307 domain-containing protein [Kineococcus siccus]
MPHDARLGEVDSLDERYGRRHAGRPWWRRPVPLVAAVLLGVLVVAYGVWVAVVQSSGPSATEITHRVLDASSAEITFAVTREPGTAVRCTVQALDEASTEVGIAQVDVPAGPAATVQETTVVRTTARSVTVGVQGCVPLDR